ncbi:Protein of unknown function DUF2115 [Methanocaldococcus infernus ME]|uniref:UPF0305 protein Metin_1447 n=1 Tax=Methanocaldococcus infernus (strain DSM 11812 / JCM 15783 / ME) TaxID=573063 RepID=D5VU42_METIM|nr:DUF2115 domain-containing protein [Methanocaldococcus infernus]ADG14095.1 Protein of unknown function DUF2115 [Methanocaldococcus infernus ME]
MKATELLKKLKEEAKNFSIYDIAKVRAFLERDAKYLPKNYREKYVNKMLEHFLKSLKEVKEYKLKEDYEIDEKKLKALLDRIENSGYDETFIRLSKIVCPFLVFIAKKPIHPLDLEFPGGLKIIKKGDKYYCPVKEKQKNQFSLCPFCICQPL